MTKFKFTKLLLIVTAAASCHAAFASANIKNRYVSADLGIFQGNYDSIYNDTNDAISANFRQQIQQYAYTGGLALGYTQKYRENYLLGIEASVNLAINNAHFATSSFTDEIKIQDYVDVVFVPGMFLSDTIAAYLKAGISVANTKDTLTSPTGFGGNYVTSKSTDYIWGAALGIGVKKFITPDYVIFTEYQYHDYGRLNLPAFQNFTTNYSHSAYVYSQAVVVGLSYFF